MRLGSAEVRISVGRSVESKGIAIEAFHSGSKPLQVPLIMFEPTAVLSGTDRYAHLSPPYGPDERFVTKLLLPIGKADQFSINFPTIIVNGSTVPLRPIGFVRVTETRLMCVQ
ncbi:hypothetical protein BWI17_00705 [Betaproteobacteria bacterium GR16-43]|nr:hypothetical protein BWI17_00705 [Betaproteobacteria bacterium GR16-43]